MKNKKFIKRVALILMAILTSLSLVACGSEKNSSNDNETKTTKANPTASIVVKDYGTIELELYPEIAPNTVNNFISLVNKGFYNGLTFHRVIKDFMIQTGDPTGTGMGGSEKEIKGEFEINGIKNNISHTRGVLSMARRGSNPETEDTLNSASSQFFIVHQDSNFLDGSYASFGKLLNGYDILDKIATTSTDQNDKPLNDIKMNSIRFVTLYEE